MFNVEPETSTSNTTPKSNNGYQSPAKKATKDTVVKKGLSQKSKLGLQELAKIKKNKIYI